MKALILLLLLVGCGKKRSVLEFNNGPVERETSEAMTFEEVKSAVLSPKCLSCHDTGGHAGHIPLATREDVLRNLIPGDPHNSRLLSIVLPGAMNMMPPFGEEPLTAEETELIRSWIKKGAL